MKKLGLVKVFGKIRANDKKSKVNSQRSVNGKWSTRSMPTLARTRVNPGTSHGFQMMSAVEVARWSGVSGGR